MADTEQPIVIKKIVKGGHGHHGGAWKVAYADFVTAMMAFFLLLWLLSATTDEQKLGISNYFSPEAVSTGQSGAGGLFGGTSISVEGALTSSGGPIIGLASMSSMPYAPVYNTQGVEVKVDKETGQVRVTRFVQAQDVGVAINPAGVEGQLEGGAVQGIGRALTEDLIIDPDTGAIRNPSLATYLMPLAMDMPEIENILVSVPSDDGPFGARAVAESPGFGPPAAIANAIYDAIGVRIKELPFSPERVKAAIEGQESPESKIDVEALRRTG